MEEWLFRYIVHFIFIFFSVCLFPQSITVSLTHSVTGVTVFLCCPKNQQYTFGQEMLFYQNIFLIFEHIFYFYSLKFHIYLLTSCCLAIVQTVFLYSSLSVLFLSQSLPHSVIKSQVFFGPKKTTI